MNSDRIKEIQAKTAYPDSISVQQALVKVWNECEQAPSSKTNEESITLTIKELKRLCKDFLSDCFSGYVSNDELYIENWLKKHK